MVALDNVGPVEMTTGIAAGEITCVNVADTVCGVAEQESATWTVAVKVPLAVGVPDSRQLDARVKPAANDPLVIEQVYGVIPPEDCS